MSQSDEHTQTLGVTFSTDQQATIGVWAPVAKAVAVSINDHALLLPLTNDGSGYWQLTTDQLKPGDRYTFLLDHETEWADSASRLQPQGVSGPSQAFDSMSAYWEDSSWVNPPIDEYIIYELDIHTFTLEGTLNALVGKLDHLKNLGVNAILIRPVTPFADLFDQAVERNFLFAVQASYGGPDQLQYAINACHYEGLAVILDLPYGPDTTSFTAADQLYRIQNALMWFRDFHVDALFLEDVYCLPDADQLMHTIREETNALTAQTGRQHYLLTDQDLTLVSSGTNSLNRQSSTGANSRVHSTNDEQDSLPSTSPRNVCLCDNTFSTVLRELFERETDATPNTAFSEILQTYHEADSSAIKRTDYELAKLLAGAILVSPCIPTLFMGEEWGVISPLRRLAHSEPTLADAEYEANERTETIGTIPPLPWETLTEQHQLLYRYYRSLTALRRQHPALYHLNPNQIRLVHQPGNHTLLLHRWYKTDHVLCLMNFCAEKQTISLPELGAPLHKLLDSADPVWNGPAASPETLTDTSQLIVQPKSIVVYTTKQ